MHNKTSEISMKTYLSGIVCLFAILMQISAVQEKKDCVCKKPPAQKVIDEAIKKGCDFLMKNIDATIAAPQKGHFGASGDTHHGAAELLLLTLIHGEKFSEKDASCKKLLEFVLKCEPRYTYRAALKAMALSALDKDKYIEYIAQAGQFLLDTQRENGAWSYGEQVKYDDAMETHSSIKNPKVREKVKKKDGSTSYPTDKITLKKRKLTQTGKTVGGWDNSNTQYAALGFRACHDSGIELPKEAIKLAKDYWEKDQSPDGGWAYPQTNGGGVSKDGKGTGVEEKKDPKRPGVAACNTMTLGGIGCLAIYKFILGECKKAQDFAKDPAIAAGIKWSAKDFETGGGGMGMMGGARKYWTDYYLVYGLERAGVLAEFYKLGDHDWYNEGAHKLLAQQSQDGSWSGKGVGTRTPVIDTCLAILFLKMATDPLTQ